MVNLKPITDAILKDAETQVEKIKEEGATVEKKLIEDAESENIKMRMEFEKKLSQEIDEMYRLRETKRREQEKSTLLAVKAEAIKAAANAAAERVCALSDEEYRQFIARLIKKTELSKDSVVYINERDKKRLDKKIFAPARLSDECIKTRGGFKVVNPDADFDMTLDMLVSEKYEEICDRISKVYERGEP